MAKICGYFRFLKVTCYNVRVNILNLFLCQFSHVPPPSSLPVGGPTNNHKWFHTGWLVLVANWFLQLFGASQPQRGNDVEVPEVGGGWIKEACWLTLMPIQNDEGFRNHIRKGGGDAWTMGSFRRKWPWMWDERGMLGKISRLSGKDGTGGCQ